jgi:membrane fusion protein (multidrug efflux system)
MKRWAMRILAGLAAIAAVGLAGYWAVGYWRVGRFLQSTDDAYLQADYTTIAPKVSGYIADVAVEDNQPVKAGQVLARIDDRDLRTALAQARADVATAAAEIRNLDARLTLQQSMIDQADAGIAADQASVAFTKEEYDRYHTLLRSGVASTQRTEQADADYREKTALLQRDQAALIAAREQVGVLQAERAKAETQRQHYQAIEQQAELNLGYATIVSPIDGTVGARSLRVGQYVQAGTQLMAVVPLQSVYVVANFKETQLAAMRDGEPAAVAVDSFPGRAIHGRVDSLSPASGLEFSLLPPDNATGNFTKIVQRIPVKIRLDSHDPLTGLLRPGMSVEATIDTKTVVMAGAGAAERLAQR